MRIGAEHDSAEARAQQAATAAILKVLNRSRGDAQPVFDAIVQTARRLLGGFSALMTRVSGEQLHMAAMTHTTRAGDKSLKDIFPVLLTRPGFHTDVVRSRAPAIMRDTERSKFRRLRAWRESVATEAPWRCR
jgi:hypothetical protein